MVFGDSGFVDQTFAEILAKAGGMRNRQPDVFVQMKHFHAPPIDFRHGDERIKEFELRGARRGNDACPTAILDRIAERNCCLLSRSAAQ